MVLIGQMDQRIRRDPKRRIKIITKYAWALLPANHLSQAFNCQIIEKKVMHDCHQGGFIEQLMQAGMETHIETLGRAKRFLQ